MNATTRRAVLDLGSNSFHVLVADVTEDGEIIPVLREREMLHLGAAVAARGHIPADASRRALAVAAHLAELARRTGVQTPLAVATSALRDASNGRQVIAAIERATGITIDVIDGPEEARRAWLGVHSSVGFEMGTTLVLDLGGGSLELAAGRGDEPTRLTSVDLGVSRLSTMAPADPPNTAEIARLDAHVRSVLDTIADDYASQGFDTVVAVGGTVRRLARTIAAQDHVWLPATVNQLEVTADRLAAMRDELLTMPAVERAALPGMNTRRAGHIHVAAVVLAGTLDRLGLDGFLVSDWGLREGTLLRTLGLEASPSPAQVRMRAVERTRTKFVPDDPHLPHVAMLTERLFDEASQVHGLPTSDRELAGHAARLHDVGESLALRNHDKHGAYLVEHAEMRGFSPSETAILATLVRFHKSPTPGGDYPPWQALGDADRDRARRILALLQVADGLDRARDQSVRDVTGRVAGGRFVLTLHGDGLHVARAEVDRKTAMFEEVFGLPIELEGRVGTRTDARLLR
ncbi:MAG: Ppx/GppA phosphatase family protein [Nitriliruptorales bacterium]|nr:Ppx/GppA phosphatase family protein [Nitriliruptorales bacterium]